MKRTSDPDSLDCLPTTACKIDSLTIMDDHRDGRSDTIESFVTDLRQLRERFPRHSFSGMAARTGVSKSTLHDAIKRTDRLPTARTVRALVSLLDVDHLPEWIARRSALNEALLESSPVLGDQADHSKTATDDQPKADLLALTAIRDEKEVNENRVRRPRGNPPWWFVALLVAVTALVSSVATLGIRGMVEGSQPQASRSTAVQKATQDGPADGTDPIKDDCVPDAVVTGSKTAPGVGVLKILFSTRCDAYWAKLARSDGAAVGNKVQITLIQDGNPNRAQRTTEPNISDAYTYVLRRLDPKKTYCATALVWTGDQKRTIGPVC